MTDPEPPDDEPEDESASARRRDDEFDSIVERLGLNLKFPDEPEPHATGSLGEDAGTDVDDEPDPPDEQL